jgi:hypothetical protein
MLPKPWRNNRYKYAMVCIDTFSKKADMEPMKDKEAKTCNAAIEKVFNRLGIPKSIYCDEGSEFTNKRIGFTGTPYINIPIEYNNGNEISNIIIQELGEGAIISSILGTEKETKIFIINNNDEINKIIELCVDGDYHVLIDVGSYFLNNTNKKIAHIILQELIKKQKDIKWVVYISENDEKLAISNDNSISYNEFFK